MRGERSGTLSSLDGGFIESLYKPIDDYLQS